MDKSFFLIISAVIVSFTFVSCKKELKGDLLIKNVNIVNVENGEISAAQDVLIIGYSIENIEAHDEFKYVASETVDGTDKYLIPGLWDMHTHNWWAWENTHTRWAYEEFFPLLLANGVTGIREMFSDLEQSKTIKQKIAQGKITGPEIVTAGPIVDGKPALWPRSDEADTPEKGREIVRQQKEAGADFIKVYSFLERDVFFAIADECKKQGIPFSGHIPFKISLEEALASGIGSIEHFLGVLHHSSNDLTSLISSMKGESKKDTLFDKRSFTTFLSRMKFETSTFDETLSKGMIDLLANNNAWICPTMVTAKGSINSKSPYFQIDDRIYQMPRIAISDWRTTQDSVLTEATLSAYKIEKESYELILSLTKRMVDHGVNFLAGTDYTNPYTYPGSSIHDELQIFVEEAGLSPLEALQTATLNPAIFLKKEEEQGTVEPGKLANLILLEANPLEDIKNVKKINATILKGELFNKEALAKMKQDILIANAKSALENPPPIKVTDLELDFKKYTGEYCLRGSEYKLSIQLLDSLLTVDYGDLSDKLEPFSRRLFRTKGYNVYYNFSINDKAQIEGFELLYNGQAYQYRKIK